MNILTVTVFQFSGLGIDFVKILTYDQQSDLQIKPTNVSTVRLSVRRVLMVEQDVKQV